MLLGVGTMALAGSEVVKLHWLHVAWNLLDRLILVPTPDLLSQKLSGVWGAQGSVF